MTVYVQKRTSLLSTRYVDANGQTLSEEHGEKGVLQGR